LLTVETQVCIILGLGERFSSLEDLETATRISETAEKGRATPSPIKEETKPEKKDKVISEECLHQYQLKILT